MGIDFDWEVEEDAPGTLSETPTPSSPGLPPGLRRLLLIVGIAAALGIAIYTAYQQRATAVENARLEELDSTVSAETAALRIGDRRAFLILQQRDDDWVRAQARAFRDYQDNADRISFSGSILSTEIKGEYGRAMVEQTIDGQERSIEWCYIYTNRRWRHSPTCGPFWGEANQIAADDVEISYYAPDEDLAQNALTTIGEWWTIACSLTACDDPPNLALEVTRLPVGDEAWQANDSEWTAQISAVGQAFLDTQGPEEPLDTLAASAAASWADLAIENIDGDPGEIAWLHNQVEGLLREQFGLGDDSFLGWMSTLYGPDVVPDALSAMRSGEAVVPALQTAIADRTAAQLPASSINDYLTAHLRAEVALHAERDLDYDTSLLFRDPASDFTTPLPGAMGFLQMVDAESIDVTSLRGFGDVTWAEIRGALTVEQFAGQTVRLYVPFREIDGRWLHVRPQPEDWGTAQLRTSPDFRLYYRTLDSPHMQGLLSNLERTYDQIANDYGYEAQTPITIVVQGLESGRGPQRPGNSDSEEIQISVSSPYLDVALLGNDGEPLPLDRQVIASFVVLALQEETNYTPNAACIQQALRQWESERVGLYAATSQGASLSRSERSLLPEHIEELWTAWSCAKTDYSGEVRQYAARALIDTLVALQGDEVIPALIDNLSDATSAEDWIARSITPAPNMEALEVRWLLHMEEGLSDARKL